MQIVSRPGSVAKLTPYLLAEGQAKGTVLVCPGGGYFYVSPREAKPIADAFNRGGYNAFVLEYTVRPSESGPDQPLLGTTPLADAAWAMAHIRENAAKYNLDPNKIAICGFSAGGHLAGSLGVYWNKPAFFGGEKAAELYRPNALILCYAVISGSVYRHGGSFANLAEDSLKGRAPFSLENHVSHLTPPTFLWHTFEDQAVPVQNSLVFAEKLIRYEVPFELHVYPHGPHGLSLATAEVCDPERCDPHVGGWIDLCVEWLGITL
jgi:acetyl esterase/lipase